MKNWYDCLFTSEIGFLFGLPYLLSLENTNRKHRPNNWFRLCLFLTTVVLNLCAMSLLFYTKRSKYVVDIISLFVVSLILHIFTYIYTRIHVNGTLELANNNTHVILYVIGNFSIINLVFGLCSTVGSRGIHFVILFANCIFFLTFVGFFFIYVPIKERFPYISNNIEDYNYGMRPLGFDQNWCKLDGIDCDGVKTIIETDFLYLVREMAPLSVGSIFLSFILIPNQISYYNIID
jgi:hypothetical protein